jgi:cytochrome P450
VTSAPATGTLSVYHLLKEEVRADPYPLYRRLQDESPVHWDPYLHAWVVTRYDDVADVMAQFRSARTASPERMTELGLERLRPIARVMTRQMLFADPPDHRRLRRLASIAFTPAKVGRLRVQMQQLADGLIDRLGPGGYVELMEGFANPFPAIVMAEMLGLPTDDHSKLTRWSEDFAEMLGNFQGSPDRTAPVLQSLAAMIGYFQDAVGRDSGPASEGLINEMAAAGEAGLLSDEEVVANLIVTMVGGLQTTTNLIGNGMLTLLREGRALEALRGHPERVPLAVEELLRYESPVQHTARLAPPGASIAGQEIAEGQAVIAVIGAANRDPARFTDPDALDLERENNRHLAFGWGAHFCVGAPLARLEAQIAFETILRRWSHIELDPAWSMSWRPNLGLRGLNTLRLLVHS